MCSWLASIHVSAYCLLQNAVETRGWMNVPGVNIIHNSLIQWAGWISFKLLLRFASPDKFACLESLVVYYKRLFCKHWVGRQRSPWCFLGFLQTGFHLPPPRRILWHLSFLQREWEGERHLEGISELSILSAAQQVKVTLHFVYFPPISICEQNGKERKSQHENKKWWKMMREKTRIPSFVFPNLRHLLLFQSKRSMFWMVKHSTISNFSLWKY